MKYTPGPWKLLPKSRYDLCQCKVYNPEGNFVVAEGFAHIRDGQTYREHWAEAEANARLIAAAPELLECLKQCSSVLEDIFKTDSRTYIKAAKELIAKIEGESK